jgi:hypothetical protein
VRSKQEGRTPSKFRFKLDIEVGKVNIAAPERAKYDQDYFVASAEEWIDGIAVKNRPRCVRQFVAGRLPG